MRLEFIRGWEGGGMRSYWLMISEVWKEIVVVVDNILNIIYAIKLYILKWSKWNILLNIYFIKIVKV